MATVVGTARNGLTHCAIRSSPSNTKKMKKKKTDTISQRVPDKFGNAIVIMMSGNVILKLASETKQRRLGYIDRNKKTLIVKRKRDKHLHYKSNSYGFNHHILSKAKTFDTILLEDEFGKYKFPVSKVMEHGRTHLQFKQQGFELQIFMPLEIIENCRVKDEIRAF